MSVSKGVGIPVKLLHEAAGHIVTVRITPNETQIYASKTTSGVNKDHMERTRRKTRGRRFNKERG